MTRPGGLSARATLTGAAVVPRWRWWPGGAVALLLVTAALDRFTYPVFGANVKPEHVATGLVLAVLVVRGVLDRRAGRTGDGPPPAAPVGPGTALPQQHVLITQNSKLKAQNSAAAACLAGYLGLNLLSSLANAPRPGDSLRLAGLVILVCLPYFLMPWLVRDARLLQRAVAGWLVLCALEAICGIAIMALYGQGIDLGVQLVGNSPPVPIGTLREGNIFGSYTAAGAVAGLGLLLSSRQPRLLWLAAAAGALALGGSLISLSRGAWLGLAGGGLLVLVVRGRAAARRGLALALLTLAGLLFILAFANSAFLDQAGRYVATRLTTLNPQTILDDQTVTERLDTYAKALEGFRTHPWIGNGTGSFGQRYTFRSVNEPAWVGNLELHLLYDTGILGLLLFAGFLGATGWAVLCAYRGTPDPEYRGLLLALSAGLIVLLIAYQATEATWLAFTWVHLGLLAVATRVAGAPAA